MAISSCKDHEPQLGFRWLNVPLISTCPSPLPRQASKPMNISKVSVSEWHRLHVSTWISVFTTAWTTDTNMASGCISDNCGSLLRSDTEGKPLPWNPWQVGKFRVRIYTSSRLLHNILLTLPRNERLPATLVSHLSLPSDLWPCLFP